MGNPTIAVPIHTDEHGVIWVNNSKITLDSIINPYLKGLTAEELNEDFPVLSLDDIYDIIEYYLDNRVALNKYLAQRNAARKRWLQLNRPHLPRRFGRKIMFVIVALVIVIFAFITMRSGDGYKYTVHTDADRLDFYFDLSHLPEPIAVEWIIDTPQTASRLAVGPTDYYVYAILEYDAPTAAFINQLELELWNQPFISTDISGQTWMPDSVIDYASTNETTAYDTGRKLLGYLSYGYVMFIENYVILYGGTM